MNLKKGLIDFTSLISSENELIVRSGIVFLINGISALLMFGLHVYLARALQYSVYSEYAYALTILTVLTGLSVVGTDTSAQRFISAHGALSQSSMVKGFIRRAFQLTLLASLIVSVLLAIGIELFSESIGKTLTDTLLMTALALPICALLLLCVSILRGFKRPIQASLPRLIIRPILIGVIIALSLSLLGDLSASMTMLIDLSATVIALAVGCVLLRSDIVKIKVEPEYNNLVWFNTTLPLFVVSSFQLLIKHTDIIIIGLFMDVDSVGSYVAAAKAGTLAAFGLMAINGVLPALIAKHHATKEPARLQKLVSLAALFSFTFSLIVAVIIFVYAHRILLLFGPEFVVAAVALKILAVGQLINASTGSIGFLLSMTGNQAMLLRVVTLTALLNIALCIMLIPSFGLIGAASSTVLSIAASNIILSLYAYKTLGIDSSIIYFFREKLQ